jgi:hypothetical protein
LDGSVSDRKYCAHFLSLKKMTKPKDLNCHDLRPLEIRASKIYGREANIKILNGHYFYISEDIDVISTLFC